MGTIRKEAPLRVALLAPSPYRTAMSSLGFQVIYREINARRDWAAERAFHPDEGPPPRSGAASLLTMEGERHVAECDVVAVSIAYEVDAAALVSCFDLAGIPLFARDREDRWPLVVIGGPLTFSNPAPVAPFADVVVMGEGEELVHRVLDAVECGGGRRAVLDRLEGVEGIWLPEREADRMPAVAAASASALPARGQIVTPHTELADMFLVEAERGCHRACTFCVMRRSTNGGMRLASPEAILGAIPAHARRVGLVGAAVSDHPRLLDIVGSIVDGGREIGLSSLRIDRLRPELVELLRRGGYRTLTVASDGASERLRRELRKGFREECLLEAAELSRRNGMRWLKVYQMLGVPGETDADVDELIEVTKRMAAVTPVVLGVSPFVPKRNTPLDGASFAGIPVVDARLDRLRRGLGGAAAVRATSARWAWVEYRLAQGGMELAQAVVEASREGGGFGAWRNAIRRFGGDDPVAGRSRRPVTASTIPEGA